MTEETRAAPTKPKRKSRAAAKKAPAASGRSPATADGVVAIFGGSGFIGQNLIQRLAAQGTDVVVAVRRPESFDFKTDASNAGAVKAVKASIHSDSEVRSAVEGASAVINLVGILAESGDQSFEAVHAEGARRVAEAARDAGVGRFVQMSALGADPNSPSAYSRTKARGEQHVRDVYPEATILRPSIVFGPEDDFFNRFAGMAKYSPALPLIGGGKTRFQPVYVEDVVGAIVRFLSDDLTKGQTYELGGPKVYTFKELMELVLAEKGLTRALLPIPFFMAEIQGSVLQMLPKPPLTRDQVESLKRDNVQSGACPGLAELGIEPTPVEDILPTYL